MIIPDLSEKVELFNQSLHRLAILPSGERYQILNQLVETTDCKVMIVLTKEPDGINEHIEFVTADEQLEIEQLRARCDALKRSLDALTAEDE